MILFSVIVTFLLLTYCNSIVFSKQFNYGRQISFSITLLIGLSLPHSFVVLFSSIFNIGLLNSLLIFATFFYGVSSYIFCKNYKYLFGEFFKDRKRLQKCKFEFLVYSGVLIAYFSIGIAFIPSTIDEIAYHIPQAVGALQENKLYEFSTNLPWVQGYPQGAAILWAICIKLAGSDLYVRSPQLLYLLSMILSLGNIFDKIGVSRDYKNLGLLSFITMPIVFILSTTNRADLAYAAYMICMLSILLSDAKNKKYSLSLIVILFFFSASVKIPVISLAIFSYFTLPLMFFRLRALNESVSLYFSSRISILFSFVLFLSTFSFFIYLSNFYLRGNPIYPIHVEFLGHLIFEGPLKFIQASGHTTFGDITQFSKVRLWHAIYYDIFSPLNEDSYGSAGLIYSTFVILFVIVAVVESIRSIGEKKSKIILLTAAFCLLPVIVPSQTLPRYHLIFSLIILVIAIYSANKFTAKSKTFLLAIYILLVPSLVVVANNLWVKVRWINAVAGTYDRGDLIQSKFIFMDGFGPDPKVVAYLKVNKFEKIYFCGNNFPTLLWNKSYSNNIEYLGSDDNSCDFNKLKGNGLLINTGVKLDLGRIDRYSIIEIEQDFGVSQLYNIVRN